MNTDHSEVSERRRVSSSPSRRRSSSKSRRLIEEYQRSVLATGREPMTGRSSTSPRAMLTRSGRRNVNTFTIRRDGSQKTVSFPPSSVADSVQWCIDQAEAAESAGKYGEVEKYLQRALEQLQYREFLTVGAVNGVSARDDAKLEQDGAKTADILRRFGKLSLRKNAYTEALALFNLSSRMNPLTPVTYALRGACQEHLGNYAEAYEEYRKYLSLSPPTMAVMAHTGQCALKAGQYEAAERYLYELLRMTKATAGSFAQHPSNSNSSLFESPSFYEAHTYYCLGLVREKQAAQAAAAASPTDSANNSAETLLKEANNFYDLAVANSAYINALEDAAESAIAVGDAPLAWENLRHLQRLRRTCAHYYSRAADVCAMIDDAAAEVEELSKALDQRQPVPTRRTTLLRRAYVYATKLQNMNKAIVDLSLLLSLPGDDHCTAMAYLQRAKAFEQRSCERSRSSKEDVGAALSDYDSFVVTALMHPQKLAVPHESITEAMLILANGAFTEKDYARASHFFARAVARGWQPREDLPREIQQFGSGTPVSSISLTGVDLLTKMYVAIAHTVVSRVAISEDMFRVMYEQREKMTPHVPSDLKKLKAAERKEAEKPMVPVPAVGYQVVEEHYLRLRALEPTVFSSLQYELLELWEPYRTEVERLREDLMLTRSGKKVKRR